MTLVDAERSLIKLKTELSSLWGAHQASDHTVDNARAVVG